MRRLRLRMRLRIRGKTRKTVTYTRLTTSSCSVVSTSSGPRSTTHSSRRRFRVCPLSVRLRLFGWMRKTWSCEWSLLLEDSRCELVRELGQRSRGPLPLHCVDVLVVGTRACPPTIWSSDSGQAVDRGRSLDVAGVSRCSTVVATPSGRTSELISSELMFGIQTDYPDSTQRLVYHFRPLGTTQR